MTTVVAGILVRGDTILICRRRADQPHPLKWEFPGGKLEPGETPEAALRRELEEELGIDSEPATEIARYEFSYLGKPPILLIFMRVTAWNGEIENRIFESILWQSPGTLSTFDFLEGDVPFLSSERLFSSPAEPEKCEAEAVNRAWSYTSDASSR
jgi:8-oxo-dGTP diphosphatase